MENKIQKFLYEEKCHFEAQENGIILNKQKTPI